MAEINKCFHITQNEPLTKNVLLTAVLTSLSKFAFCNLNALELSSILVSVLYFTSIAAFSHSASRIPASLLAWKSTIHYGVMYLSRSKYNDLRCLIVKSRINTCATPISASRFTAAVCAFPAILSKVMIQFICYDLCVICSDCQSYCNHINNFIYLRHVPRDAR